MENPERACFHCGEPIPSTTSLFILRDGARHPVCCSGCQAVAELIVGSGLGRYYRFRQRLGRKAEEDVQRAVTAWESCDGRRSLWGVEIPGQNRDLLLQTEGIRCAACAWLIRSHLETMPGVKSVQVDTATGFTRILWNPHKTRLSRLARALMELGYKPHLPLAGAEEQGRQSERRDSMKRLGVAAIGMMQVMMYAVGMYAGDAYGMARAERGFLEWVSLLVTLPVVLYSGRIFFEGAWRSVLAKRPGMDVPVALAIGLAFLASCINFFRGEGAVWFDSVVMFIFFLTLGRHVEMSLRHRNLQTGAALARLLPEWAERERSGMTETVPAMDLVVGDRVSVAQGQAFPADGVLLRGQTEVDEALLSGESRPSLRIPGDSVIAGSINLAQPVIVEVTAAGNETTVSSIGRLLLGARRDPSASPGIPGVLVPVFILAVLGIAFLTWLGWSLVDAQKAFPAMLTVLVASCPCALSLALPAVHAAASQRLLDEGILLTRTEALQALTRVDWLVFDKTGTLTVGRPRVSRVQLNPERAGFTEKRALDIAGGIEAASAHPLARAFTAGSRMNFDSVTVSPGKGLEAVLNGQRWRLGRSGFAAATGHDAEDEGHTEIWLSDPDGWVARFALADTLREDAVDTICRLEAAGLKLSILSGDGEAAVARVARTTGISSWKSRLSPEDKLEAIRAARSEGHRVLMVGDGVNDAPVLAAADVSMTVKGGSELANSAADMILTGDSLGLVRRARKIAQRAQSLIRQNLAWALLYNASVMPLAVSGLLQPWMAALGMSISSLLVTANAARLTAGKPRVEVPKMKQAPETSPT